MCLLSEIIIGEGSLQGSKNVSNLLLGQVGEKWQRNRPLRQALAMREVTDGVAEPLAQVLQKVALLMPSEFLFQQ